MRKLHTGFSHASASEKAKEVFSGSSLPGQKDIRLEPFRDVQRFSKLHARYKNSETPFPDLHLVTDKTRCVDSQSQAITCQNLCHHFGDVEDYWNVAEVMHQKSLIPLVHGQPTHWLIPQKIIRQLGYNTLQTLRFSNSIELSSRAQILQDVRTLYDKPNETPVLGGLTSIEGKLDHDLRGNLLSATLGLFHYESCESPVSFVYGGGTSFEWSRSDFPGNRSILDLEDTVATASEMIFYAMKQKGHDDEKIATLLNQLTPLYKQSTKLERGQIMVLGVPYKSVSEHAYHCSAFGEPTGIPVEKVLEKLSSSKMPPQGAQVRIVMSQELMDLNDSVEVVNIMDKRQVESYLHESAFDPIPDEGALSLFRPASSSGKKKIFSLRGEGESYFNDVVEFFFSIDRIEERNRESKNCEEYKQFQNAIDAVILSEKI